METKLTVASEAADDQVEMSRSEEGMVRSIAEPQTGSTKISLICDFLARKSVLVNVIAAALLFLAWQCRKNRGTYPGDSGQPLVWTAPLKKHAQDWEELGDLDPLWAIASYDPKRFGKWDLEEFFQTGEDEIQKAMTIALRLGYPKEYETALDFGCGVGRLTRGLARRFASCYGVDIAETMIVKAKELNRSVLNCSFIINRQSDLHIFTDNFFDMIYTTLVLQHLPNSYLMKSYITEFVRILKPSGLLVFQLPTHIALHDRLQLRRRLYGVLRRLGISKLIVYEKLTLHPVRMNALPENEVRHLLSTLGATVVEARTEHRAGPGNRDRTYYVTK